MGQTIHHLSCISMCPRLGFLVNEHKKLVIHVVVIETERDGLIVVDTGYGAMAARDPSLIPRGFSFLARPQWDYEATAVAQIEAMGHKASDVRHVVVTHLDLDHAGGLRDFPDAVCHLHSRELASAQERNTAAERRRYLPYQFEGVKFEAYDDAGDDWFGFEAVRELRGIEADIGLVPLFGHTKGHTGVAIGGGDKWLLHAGDAYFHHSDIEDPPRGTKGLDLFQRVAEINRKARLANRDRLVALARDHADDIEMFSAHDPTELERYL